ncbi:MAG: winged helix-turn-helix transcriptional regulator [Candidatus Kapaibacteriales bacterium]
MKMVIKNLQLYVVGFKRTGEMSSVLPQLTHKTMNERIRVMIELRILDRIVQVAKTPI